MKQAFKDVTEFNLAAGRTPGDLRDPKIPELRELVREELARCTAWAFPRVSGHETPGEVRAVLAARLIMEEAVETIAALSKGDTAEFADGLADLIYVCLDAAVAFGIDMPAVWAEVQRANMSKFPLCPSCGGRATHGDFGNGPEPCGRCDGRGRLVYRDVTGKVIKPPSWTPPDIAAVLARQRNGQRTGRCPTCDRETCTWHMSMTSDCSIGEVAPNTPRGRALRGETP